MCTSAVPHTGNVNMWAEERPSLDGLPHGDTVFVASLSAISGLVLQRSVYSASWATPAASYVTGGDTARRLFGQSSAASPRPEPPATRPPHPSSRPFSLETKARFTFPMTHTHVIQCSVGNCVKPALSRGGQSEPGVDRPPPILQIGLLAHVTPERGWARWGGGAGPGHGLPPASMQWALIWCCWWPCLTPARRTPRHSWLWSWPEFQLGRFEQETFQVFCVFFVENL